MKKLLLFSMIFGLLGFASCDIEVDDGKYADDVAGTYTISSIESNISGYELLTGSVTLTETDDNTVDMLIDFDLASVTDLNVPGVICSDASNGDIDLDKTASNATGVGYENDGDLRFKLTYDDGNFIDITAAK